MPQSAFTIAVTGGQAQDIQTLESGILEAVSLFPETIGIGNAEAYAEVYIGTTETPVPLPTIILANGYLGASHAIGWTGQILMEPSFCILTRIWCEQNFSFRLNFMTMQE